MQAIRESQARPLLVCCGSAAEYGAAIVDGEPVCEIGHLCAAHRLRRCQARADECCAVVFGSNRDARAGCPDLQSDRAGHAGVSRARRFCPPDRVNAMVLAECLQTGNLHVFRDFIDVDQVTRAFWLLAQNPDARGVVNVCSGQATELSLLVRLLIHASGKDVAIENIPARQRGWEPVVVIGSTSRITRLGAAQPEANFVDLVERIWQEATTRQATAS